MLRKAMGLIGALGVTCVLGCGDVPQARGDDDDGRTSASDRRVYVQYHLWYSKDDVPTPGYEHWNMWSQTTPGAGIEDGVGPEVMRTPWKRSTMSRLGLPLTGPYSSITDLDTVEYQFTVAQQAGIDGMFASVYDGRWNDIFRSHLDIAQGVGMQLGMELYHGVGLDRPAAPAPYDHLPTQANGCTVRRGFMRAALISTLREFKDHPAYLRIDGRPAIWLANVSWAPEYWQDFFPGSDCAPRSFLTWGSRAEFESVLHDVQYGFDYDGHHVDGVGEDFAVLLSGPLLDEGGERYADIPWVVRINAAGNVQAFWEMFGVDRQQFEPRSDDDRVAFEAYHQQKIDTAKAQAGAKAALHAYPAFDERGLFPALHDRGSGLDVPRTVIGRDGNGMYAHPEGFLRASLDKAAANGMWVVLESWNDWNEQHQIEPAFAQDGQSMHQDPFAALRQVARFKGLGEVSFVLPEPAMLDAPLRDTGRHRQWQGLTRMSEPTDRVRLTGGVGLGHGASGSNGVALSLSYLDDDGAWKNIAWVADGYDNHVRSFDIDITDYLHRPIVLGMESLGSTSSDWAYITDFTLDWYGQRYPLDDGAYLSQLHWHSSQGTVPWGTANSQGTATLATNVTMEDGVTRPRALYLHPDWNYNGFMHVGLDLDPVHKSGRVTLRGKLGLGLGATGSDGVAFQVYYLEDDRSYQPLSSDPATRWQNAAWIEKDYTGHLESFEIDITGLLDKPAIGFGIEADGHANSDWAHIADLELDWYGTRIDLLDPAILAAFHWHSGAGNIGWGSSSPSGSATVFGAATLEDGQPHRALYMHPNWAHNGFVHTGLDFSVLGTRLH